MIVFVTMLCEQAALLGRVRHCDRRIRPGPTAAAFAIRANALRVYCSPLQVQPRGPVGSFSLDPRMSARMSHLLHLGVGVETQGEVMSPQGLSVPIGCSNGTLRNTAGPRI